MAKLKKKYDKIKFELNRSGNKNISWKFYGAFEEMYYKDPQLQPVAIASSSGILTLRSSEQKKDLSPNLKKKKVAFEIE